MQLKWVSIIVLVALSVQTTADEPHWPEFELTDEYRLVGELEATAYVEAGRNASLRSQDYAAGNNYLNYGTTMLFSESERLKRDQRGIPMIKYGEEYYYNVVTVAEFALHKHGAALAGRGSMEEFFVPLNKLIEMQAGNGGWIINYPYRHYTERAAYRRPRYGGAMGPGLALSAFARGYQETGDAKYLEAGNRALDFMTIPFPYGPKTSLNHLDPSLSEYVFFLEYMTNPHVYTLNGYMFALLGLYDWSVIAKSERAGELFKKGITTLEHILPYYDIGTFSAYDLSYITHGLLQPYLEPRLPHVAASYHAFHIAQLRALASVTGSPILSAYAEKWQSYVE